MKKTTYTQAEVEVISLLSTDIITSSAGSWSGSGGDIDPDGWI